MILRGPASPEFLTPLTLPEILRTTASRFPQKTALQFRNTALPYSALVQQAEQIASALAALGAAPNRVLGLWMPRGLDLWISQAAISFSGAAWLPLDPDTPPERAASCLQSAQATGLLSTRAWASRLEGFPIPVWFHEDLLLKNAPSHPPEPVRPEHAAYVIYTSGSSGTPKGISITHANLTHLLRSENAILQIQPDDRVYQGFSPAFDMSLEETWISFLVGASVWIAPPETTTDPDALLNALEKERITVLHAVPTLAALLNELPPNLRLVNLGGEACPESLVHKLARHGRRLFNTYGPTETTITASLAELHPGQPVTIGKPLPNYGMLLLSAEGQPLPAGDIGEIAIFGPGLSSGYLHQPELTAQRFIANPLATSPEESRLYLTGDLGKINEHGELLCLGRVDQQIKLRGFRIELEEIAAALNRLPGIATAAAVLRKLHGTDEIVAFAVPSDSTLNGAQLRTSLQAILPTYMVPARIELLEKLPRLASGKIDLHHLRRLELSTPSPSSPQTLRFSPQTASEKALWNALAPMFPEHVLRPHLDFFNDLGGHSLLAARLITQLRKHPEFAQASVHLIYQQRSLGKIASALAALQTGSPNPPPCAATPPRPAGGRRALCGLAQLLCLPFLLLFDLLQWLVPFFAYHYFTGSAGDSIPFAAASSIGAHLLILAVSFPVAIGLKRLFCGRLSPGVYELWGITYFRWWLSQQLLSLCPVHLISGTPWMSLYLQMLGAKIGPQSLLNSFTFGVPELLDIGAHCSVGTFANLANARVEKGRLHLGLIQIGQRSCIDSYAVLEDHTQVGESCHLLGQSTLSSGRSMPSGETWGGAPARKVNPVQERWEPARPLATALRLVQILLFALGAAGVSVLFFIPTFPAFMLIDWIDSHFFDLFETERSGWQSFPIFLLLAIPAALALVALTAALAGLLRKALPRQKPGRFSIHSRTYLCKWLVSTVFDHSLHVLHGLYASVFVRGWLQLMGAKVGRGSEVSTAEGLTPDLLELGNDCFIADGALLGDEEQHDGWTQLRGIRVGDRGFVGNGAYVPDGAQLPHDFLLGVQSAAPANEQMAPGQTWLGSPAIHLPARENVCLPRTELTFRPSRARRWARGALEALRIVFPLAVIISAGYLIVYKTMGLIAEQDFWGSLKALMLSAGLYSLGSYLLVLTIKWLSIGRYRAGQWPMWTPFVWISEAVTVLYEALAVPALLQHLTGTPFLPWALRGLGAKIGRGAWINTTDLTEFDCVVLGDYCELNAFSGPQTHLFEDRIMRIGHVNVGPHATLGTRSTVLYDASVGAHCCLGPLTLVAKGEHLPPNTAWEGSPASQPLPLPSDPAPCTPSTRP